MSKLTKKQRKIKRERKLTRKAIKRVIRHLEVEWVLNCKTYGIGCASCEAERIVEALEDVRDCL